MKQTFEQEHGKRQELKDLSSFLLQSGKVKQPAALKHTKSDISFCEKILEDIMFNQFKDIFKFYNVKKIKIFLQFPSDEIRFDAPYNRDINNKHKKTLGESIAENGWMPGHFMYVNSKKQAIDRQHSGGGAIEYGQYKYMPVVMLFFDDPEEEASYYRYMWASSKGLSNLEVWANYYYSGSPAAEFLYKVARDPNYKYVYQYLKLKKIGNSQLDSVSGTLKTANSKLWYTPSQACHAIQAAAFGRSREIKADNMHLLEKDINSKPYEELALALNNCFYVYHSLQMRDQSEVLKRAFFTLYAGLISENKLQTKTQYEEFIRKFNSRQGIREARDIIKISSRFLRVQALELVYNKGRDKKNKINLSGT